MVVEIEDRMENIQQAILEQYKIYNYSKEKFTDRTFQTNRFFLVVSLVTLSATYIVNLLTPDFKIVIAVSALGMFTSVLWWLNVDSYGKLIKVKYAAVLEVLEQSLPKQPFKDEFREISHIAAERKSFQYPFVQKSFAVVVFIAFALVCAFNIWAFLKFGLMR